jgi:hypothetical protein
MRLPLTDKRRPAAGPVHARHSGYTTPRPHARHVCALVRESCTLDKLDAVGARQLLLPRCTSRRPATLPAESPAALLVLQALDPTKQQEEAGGGTGAECGAATPG